MLSQDHSSLSTSSWCSICLTKYLHRLSGAISGKLINVAVILPGFFQWRWNVAGIDTLSMQCSLHGWIPQLMTDSVYGSAWVSEDSVCWEWDNRRSDINSAAFSWWKWGCTAASWVLFRLIQIPQTLSLLHWFWIWCLLLPIKAGADWQVAAHLWGRQYV